MTAKPVIVVAEDDTVIRKELLDQCRRCGFDVPEDLYEVEDYDKAVAAISKYYGLGTLAGVVTDLDMPVADGEMRQSGWRVLSHAATLSQRLMLALYTAYGNDHMVGLFRSPGVTPNFRIFIKSKARQPIDDWIREAYRRWTTQTSVILQDADIAKVFDTVAPIYAKSALPILIVGRVGTGKQYLARHIHRLSGSAERPFVTVNCATLDDETALEELFGSQGGKSAHGNNLGLVLHASGYEQRSKSAKTPAFDSWLGKGYTLEEADEGEAEDCYVSPAAEARAGTLFLDDVEASSPRVAAALAKLLSTRQVHPLGYSGKGFRTYCRVIAATSNIDLLQSTHTQSRDPDKQGSQSRFRKDLFYGLAGVILNLPDLSRRSAENIEAHLRSPSLWRTMGLMPMEFTNEATQRVVNLYRAEPGPSGESMRQGNIHALRNLVHRAALIAVNNPLNVANMIELADVELAIKHGQLESDVGADEGDYVLQQFRRAASELGIEVGAQVTTDTLRGIESIALANALLHCLVMPRSPRSSSPGSYYKQAEIERFLVNTGASSVFNKIVTPEHIREAAIKFRDLSPTEVEDASISEVTECLRRRGVSTPQS